MDLLLSRFEVVSVAIAVIVGRTITVDGASNWLEGAGPPLEPPGGASGAGSIRPSIR